jgi:hypothetical protein
MSRSTMPGGLLAILHGQNGEDVWDSYVENNVALQT